MVDINKNGIKLLCKNNSEFFYEERDVFISAEKIASAEIGATYCPHTGVVRALNCETVIILEKWHGQILIGYLNFGSADAPEVDFYGIETKFLKIFLETDDRGQYTIARYQIFDGDGNILEEEEF
jgi:hypothetical protein